MSGPAGGTQRPGSGGTAVHHPLFARVYARQAAAMETHGAADVRRRLLAGVAGRVLEVGAGTGVNFAHLPPEVRDLVAVEPEPHLRERAREAAGSAGMPVEVVDGVADRLPVAGGSVDAVVVSLVLCSVPDQAVALEEIRRVLRPGGRLHFWEHVAADTPGLQRAQRFADATVWPRVAGGCHTSRDTVAAITAAGFTVERVERFRFPDIRLSLPTTPQVLGVASLPG